MRHSREFLLLFSALESPYTEESFILEEIRKTSPDPTPLAEYDLSSCIDTWAADIAEGCLLVRLALTERDLFVTCSPR